MTHPFNAEMPWFQRLLHEVLCRVLDYRDIVKKVDGRDTLYMRRFYVWQRKLGPGMERRGALFLHAIVRSDGDRHCHCHPWWFRTFCLAGGYSEELGTFGSHRITGVRVLRLFRTRWNPAERVHKVTLNKRRDGSERPAWTLVLVGPAYRVWGFHTERGFVDFKSYLGADGEDHAYAEDVVSEGTEER